jgi:hypothetical protein
LGASELEGVQADFVSDAVVASSSQAGLTEQVQLLAVNQIPDHVEFLHGSQIPVMDPSQLVE